jgi:hypothetical protein
MMKERQRKLHKGAKHVLLSLSLSPSLLPPDFIEEEDDASDEGLVGESTVGESTAGEGAGGGGRSKDS